jgi:hypothetical protein
VVERGETHADLEAHEEGADDELVDEMRVNLQEGNVVDRQRDKQKQAEYVGPDIDLWRERMSDPTQVAMRILTVSFVHQKMDSQQSFEGSIVRYPLRMNGLNCRYVGACNEKPMQSKPSDERLKRLRHRNLRAV